MNPITREHAETLHQLLAITQVAIVVLDDLQHKKQPTPNDKFLAGLLESSIQYAEKELDVYEMIDRGGLV